MNFWRYKGKKKGVDAPKTGFSLIFKIFYLHLPHMPSSGICVILLYCFVTVALLIFLKIFLPCAELAR